MKKFILFAILVLLFGFLSVTTTHAVTTELVSETETEKVYDFLSTAPQESSAIQVRLSVTGGTITDVTNPGGDNFSYLPACENGGEFTPQNICVEIASIGSVFTENQPVLRITVSTTPDSQVIFSPEEDHAYLTISGELMKENGVVTEVFPTQAPVEEPAPVLEDSKTNTNDSLPFVLLLGILVVLVGAFLAIIFFSDKDTQKNNL